MGMVGRERLLWGSNTSADTASRPSVAGSGTPSVGVTAALVRCTPQAAAGPERTADIKGSLRGPSEWLIYCQAKTYGQFVPGRRQKAPQGESNRVKSLAT